MYHIIRKKTNNYSLKNKNKSIQIFKKKMNIVVYSVTKCGWNFLQLIKHFINFLYIYEILNIIDDDNNNNIVAIFYFHNFLERLLICYHKIRVFGRFFPVVNMHLCTPEKSKITQNTLNDSMNFLKELIDANWNVL